MSIILSRFTNKKIWVEIIRCKDEIIESNNETVVIEIFSEEKRHIMIVRGIRREICR